MTSIAVGLATNQIADGCGGLQVNSGPEQNFHNDQCDAYRHALVSAEMARLWTQS